MIYAPSKLTLHETLPVIVISPPRSGSSLTAGLLSKASLFCGHTKEPDKWNAKGYYENIQITKVIVDYLKSHDEKLLGKKWHPRQLSADLPGFDRTVVDILKSEGMQDNQRWLYKNNKVLFCWKLWHRYFPNAQWVIVNREREENINSLMSAPFMDAYTTRHEWGIYLDTVRDITDSIRSECDTYELDIHDVIESKKDALLELMVYIGLGYVEIAKTQINQKLWSG